MWLMKTLLTSGCTNQRGAGQCEKCGQIIVSFKWICPYISRHLLSLNPLLARCRRYSRGER
ncbi:TPA: hypothetical protein MG630_25575 [Klebsiella pneumoniae]|nr:hypothetical protein [Klebsiella pneumoniae]